MAGEQGGPRGFRMVDDGGEPLAELSFSTVVISLASSALVHLGVAPEPGAEAPGQIDRGAARHTIDMLEILREKTRGNLDENEARLLEQVLHDLHLRYLSTK
jgi:hypothetical protein